MTLTLNGGQTVYLNGSTTPWVVVRQIDEDLVRISRIVRNPHDARTKPGGIVWRTVNIVRLRKEP